MFRALLCPSSGARDYDVDYHICHVVLGLLYVGVKVRVGWSSVRTAANQERHDKSGNQHHSRELLMMGIVMLETC